MHPGEVKEILQQCRPPNQQYDDASPNDTMLEGQPDCRAGKEEMKRQHDLVEPIRRVSGRCELAGDRTRYEEDEQESGTQAELEPAAFRILVHTRNIATGA
jgi:hypothetical protein